MCLAISGKIESISIPDDPTFKEGKVNFGGIQKHVSLAMVPEAKVGDYVLVHVGVAISVVDEEEALQTFEYLKEMGDLDDLNSNAVES